MIRLATILPSPLKMKRDVVNYLVLWQSKFILKRLKNYEYIDITRYVITLEELEKRENLR